MMVPSFRALLFPLILLSTLAGASPSRIYDRGGKKPNGGTKPYPGKVREYNFTITWNDYAPDGFTKKMLLVNGHSPGPVITADQDDWVVINLHNYSPYNVTIHYHGIEMLDTPYSDGVPGVTQRGILPGARFKYKWKATQYGSYWYHAHFLGQIEDGLYGPIVLHPRDSDPKPFHLISSDAGDIKGMLEAEKKVVPLMIADETHLTSSDKWDQTLKAQFEDSCYDSILFNGKGRVICIPADEMAANLSNDQKTFLSLIPGSTLTDKGCVPADVMIALGGGQGNPSGFAPGVFSGCTPTEGQTEVIKPCRHGAEWVAIDVIGSLNFVTGVFSIDEHDLWVYSMDGSYIEPQKVQSIVVTNGDRFSVLVNLTKKGNFKIRFNVVSAPQMLIGNAILSVDTQPGDSDSTPFVTLTGAPLSANVVYFNQSIAHPYPADPIPAKADALHQLNLRPDGASYLWALNGTRLMPIDLDNEEPILFHPKPYIQNNVTITTRQNNWIDLVFFASVVPQPPHAIHKHGTKMYMIGSGTGPFKWNSVDEAIKEVPNQFNLVNPPRRDGFATLAATTDVTWIVVRYHASIPGAWLLHCHIQNHMLGGMMMAIQDGVDNWPQVPKEYLDGRNGYGSGF